jgi:hypothetical protein
MTRQQVGKTPQQQGCERHEATHDHFSLSMCCLSKALQPVESTLSIAQERIAAEVIGV